MEQGARSDIDRLMERLADGDRAAFDPVFETLWPVLRAFCVRAVGVADAEDAAQAALVRIFARAAEYDRTRRAVPWAVEIAVWECRSVRRRRVRRREVHGSVPSAAPDSGRSPEEAAVEADLRAAVQDVLGTLSPLDIETITCVRAGAGGARGATFRKRVERALARFRLAWRARHGSD